MLQLHRRLAWTFRGELTWFERKLYSSLSQEVNKAMNLNSYIGLMGHSFEVRQTPEGQVLAPAGNTGSLVIPDADFLLTLDADSIILPEYCLRLVYVMTQPENARLAVIQTPYSAFPGSPTRMERLSGATTDLQHIVHQGMSYYGATFWVGANAVIRKRALDDIVEVEHQGGFEIRRYVMDRTVIEDTESSLDLAIHGWWLLNYPERLSYSATPPDFGSLCIQRRRWANGGLIILPKLWQLRRARHQAGREQPHHRDVAAGQLSRLDLLEQRRVGVPAGLPVRQQTAQPVGAARRAAVLHRDVVGSEALRLQADGHLPGLRLQPDPAAGQPGRCRQVDPAGDHRAPNSVRPNPQGRQPDRDLASCSRSRRS